MNEPTESLAPGRVGVASGIAGYADAAAVRAGITEALEQAGLARSGRPAFEGIVPAGASVLLKPNWVYHRNESGAGRDCLNTHGAFIEEVVRLVAACSPSRIILGDAPIQGCAFDEVTGADLAGRLETAAAQGAGRPVPVLLRDFRKVRLLRGEDLAAGRETAGRSDADYVLFDLGADSLLDPISRPEGRFRVTMYDPRALARTHRPGTHQYVIAREVFDVDVVINLPKLKTHRKAGITNALKNLVGINGNKDYLPHHRVGGSWTGGDCYGGFDPLRRAAEWCLDKANGSAGTPAYRAWRARADRLLAWNRRIGRGTDVEGGWHGNDTCWRMSLDLNRILLYGRAAGSFAESRQRRVVSLVDAIVAGQAEGPLAPEPLALGLVLAGDDAPAVDTAGAAMLGLEPDSLPIVREAFGSFRWPIAAAPAGAVKVHWQGGAYAPRDLAARIGGHAISPAGWRGQVEAA
jgi:uncharacterized protein (DUF362 family)